MIRYALRCADGHRFESWFQSADAFDGLAEKGLVSCAVCGRSDVAKAIMAPQVAPEAGSPAPEPSKPLSTPSHPMEVALRAFRAHIEANSTYVGGRFAAEARAMHLGEKDDAPIHGEANPAEARALIEDGVPILPIPMLPKAKAN